jgi:hypothetical protein
MKARGYMITNVYTFTFTYTYIWRYLLQCLYRYLSLFLSRLPDCPGYKCKGGQQFSVCAPVCGSCRDRQKGEEYCAQDKCVAGCTCPEGELLNDNGHCVPPTECTCFDSYDAENPVKNHGDVSERGCATW